MAENNGGSNSWQIGHLMLFAIDPIIRTHNSVITSHNDYLQLSLLTSFLSGKKFGENTKGLFVYYLLQIRRPSVVVHLWEKNSDRNIIFY